MKAQVSEIARRYREMLSNPLFKRPQVKNSTSEEVAAGYDPSASVEWPKVPGYGRNALRRTSLRTNLQAVSKGLGSGRQPANWLEDNGIGLAFCEQCQADVWWTHPNESYFDITSVNRKQGNAMALRYSNNGNNGGVNITDEVVNLASVEAAVGYDLPDGPQDVWIRIPEIVNRPIKRLHSHWKTPLAASTQQLLDQLEVLKTGMISANEAFEALGAALDPKKKK